MTVLCVCMSVMLTVFFLYHVWMALKNTTTNERAKKSDIKYFYERRMLILEEMKETPGCTVCERDRESFDINIKWTKQQVEQ